MEKIKMNFLLKYYLDLTGTDHLHWGLWREGDPLDLEHLQAAQERYADHLLGLIPSDVTNVLDVGCGVGGIARKLEERGYRVTALAPDPYQQKQFRKRTGGRIPFVLSRFEDYAPEASFDLILMSESVQYLPLAESFAKARELLRPGGYLLTSDCYRLDSSRGSGAFLPYHFLTEFLGAARPYGFELLDNHDISEAVLPTLQYGQMIFSRYIRPTLRMPLLALKVHVPILYRTLRFGLRRSVKGRRLRDMLRDRLTPLSPEVFQSHVRYVVHLFRITPGPG
ncbi:MAG: class I SAM-dependent methyltransferase [bacterium]